MDEAIASFFGMSSSPTSSENVSTADIPSTDQVLIYSEKNLEQIAELILSITSLIEKSVDEKKSVEKELSRLNNYKHYETLSSYGKRSHVFSSPYFVDTRGFHAPKNDDETEKRDRHDFDAYAPEPRPWTKGEMRKLMESAQMNARDKAMKPLLSKLEYLEGKKKVTLFSPAEKKKVKREMEDLKKRVSDIRNGCADDKIKDHYANLDWLYVSSIYMKGIRTPEECEKMWKNLLHPDINKRPFSREEDERLKAIALQHSERRWDEIARELQTNRTAIQCFERYQSCLSDKIKKKYWTEEEDEQLIRTVEACRIGEFIPWKKVAYFMSPWTFIQVMNRWERVCKPQNKGGPWSAEEDAILCLGVQALGPCWVRLSALLYGRTAYLCRERYTGVLDPELVTGQWSLAEDIKLFEMLAKYGEKWGKISRHFDSRTDNMVNQRATVLRRHHPSLYDKIIKTRDFQSVKKSLPKKQVASSKLCVLKNQKRKEIRDAALAAAIPVVEKVCTEKINVSECKTFAELASGLNYNALKEISKVLVPRNENLTRPVASYRVKSESRRSDDDTEWEILESDHDSDVNVIEDDEEEEEEEEEENSCVAAYMRDLDVKSTIDRVEGELRDLFVPGAMVGPRIQKSFQLKTTRQFMERTFLLNLMKQTFIGEEADTSESEEEVTELPTNSRQARLEESVTRVTELFVMPPCSDGELPLFPPNQTTMTAGLLFFSDVKTRIPISAAHISEKATNLINSVTDDSQTLCPYCQKSTEDNQENGACASQSQEVNECMCDKIKIYKKKWNLLRHRVLSTFFWPGLLSMNPLTPEQLESLKEK